MPAARTYVRMLCIIFTRADPTKPLAGHHYFSTARLQKFWERAFEIIHHQVTPKR